MPPAPIVTPTPRPAPAADEVRRRAAVRLAERFDPAKFRGKPISLVRQEARRALDLFLEVEVPQWPKTDRDKLAEEVVAEALNLGPLDELFRDPAATEFMTLAHNQVIRRQGDAWLPTSVTFRDRDEYRRVLARLIEKGESLVPGGAAAGAADVRLANGFRAVVVFPPAVLDQPPVAVFVRAAPASGSVPPPPPRAVTQSPVVGRGGSDVISLTATERAPSGPPSTTRMTDPMAWLRKKVTERLIQKLAAAGVYDLGALPPAELHRLIAAYVGEFVTQERLPLDGPSQEQLTLEILTGMNR